MSKKKISKKQASKIFKQAKKLAETKTDKQLFEMLGKIVAKGGK
jgi:hypothetical protein